MEHNFKQSAHCIIRHTHNVRKTPFFAVPPPHLQKAVLKITAQVEQMTTREHVILYDMGNHSYHQTKVARGVQ